MSTDWYAYLHAACRGVSPVCFVPTMTTTTTMTDIQTNCFTCMQGNCILGFIWWAFFQIVHVSTCSICHRASEIFPFTSISTSQICICIYSLAADYDALYGSIIIYLNQYYHQVWLSRGDEVSYRGTEMFYWMFWWWWANSTSSCLSVSSLYPCRVHNNIHYCSTCIDVSPCTISMYKINHKI